MRGNQGLFRWIYKENEMTKIKKTQLITIWLLPIILVGGLFVPVLGYIVAVMMVILLILSYFKGRYWCANLCPRGAFLDIVLSKLSLKKKMPRLFSAIWFKWMILIGFMAFFGFQIAAAPKTVAAIGFVFVRMCIVTTLISIFIGVPIHYRAWCTFCPMGTLQTIISKHKKE